MTQSRLWAGYPVAPSFNVSTHYSQVIYNLTVNDSSVVKRLETFPLCSKQYCGQHRQGCRELIHCHFFRQTTYLLGIITNVIYFLEG